MGSGRLAVGLLTGIAICLAAPTADSNTQRRADSASCRRECSATSPVRAENSNPVQACLIRCGASEAFQRQQFSATSGTSGRGASPPTPGAQQGRVGQGPSAAALPTTSMVPGQGSGPAPTRSSAPRYGAIYTAPPPAQGFGITAGLFDRIAAHRVAENACVTLGGASCRLALEFTTACGAVAHGVRRSPGALMITSDPSTYRLFVVGHGIGDTQRMAEDQAVSDCARRDRGLICRIARSSCAAR